MLEYLSNNKEGLLPWQERGIRIPEAGPGIVYKKHGSPGEPELYRDYAANEKQEDALVGKRSEQHGEGTVPEREP